MEKTRKRALYIQKMATGVDGLDEITSGGLPQNRTTILAGGAGCGKTLLALQILVNGACARKETGIFVAFEENTEHIIQNAASFGWDLQRLQKEKLFFLDARPAPDVISAGGFDLTAMLSGIALKAKDLNAKVVVFDSLDVLFSLLNDPILERKEMHRIYQWLSQEKLTGILTVKIDPQNPTLLRIFSDLQFVADAVVVLSHRVVDRVSMRDLRVLKYRGSGFAENESPMAIGPSGIEVAGFAPTKSPRQVTSERVSSGIKRLDHMLGGGFYRGSSILISGSPGTSKSTLCGAFLEAACKRNERAMYVSFDEEGAEIVRNLSSVNIQLKKHIDKGLLKMHSARTEARSAEEHLLNLRTMIRTHRPRCIAVDPLSALVKAGGCLSAQGVAERLLYLTKTENITIICASLLESPVQMEGTAIEISTVADTWIHLSYAVQNGERNRALTIVKSRGMSHSNQVREVLLSGQGVTLADVFTCGGEVLMGTLRWQKEQVEKQDHLRQKSELAQKKRRIELERAELITRLEVMRKEIEIKEMEIQMVSEDDLQRRNLRKAHEKQLRSKRSAD